MKKVLTIDDSLFMRKILISILSSSNKYEVIEANSSTQGLKVFKAEKPDLVLLDIAMSKSDDGIKVLKEIKKSNPDTKVVMITSIDEKSIIKSCKELGAEDYITKPFDENKILKTVEDCLA